MTKIAVIEDDRLYQEALVISLQKEGYEVISGYSCRDGMELLKENPDFIVLDIGLTDGSGMELCRTIKNTTTIPVVFLTARDEESEMLQAYDNGCDDYIVKPFPLSVLKKKIQTMLSRSNKDQIRYRDFVLDCQKKTVTCRQQKINLTAKEYELVEYLARNRGCVISKTKLLQNLWDAKGKFVDENTVNVTINRVRRKIEPDLEHPIYITNVFGMGYKFGD